MPAPRPYNGHRSYNAWNVSLWLYNDESLYNMVRICCETARRKRDCAKRQLKLAESLIWHNVQGERTPGGAPYSRLSIREAIREDFGL
jgi:hypothetical protein